MKSFTKSVLLALLICNLLAITAPLPASDLLEIDFTTDNAYLPSKINIKVDKSWECRAVIKRSVQFFYERYAQIDSCRVLMTLNRAFAEDKLPRMQIKDYTTDNIITDQPLRGQISDVLSFYPGSLPNQHIAVTLCDNDSAFVLDYAPEELEWDCLYLTGGSDNTANGQWLADVWILAEGDYDFDTKTELFIQVFAGEDKAPRVLYCIETSPLRVEWELDLSTALLFSSEFALIPDSISPRVMFASYGSCNNTSDSNFTDTLGYLTSVDYNGSIIFNEIIASAWQAPVLQRYNDSDTLFLLYHTLNPTPSSAPLNLENVAPRLSLIGEDGTVRKTVSAGGTVTNIWTYANDRTGTMEFATIGEGVIRVYNEDLVLLAQSDETGFGRYLGSLSVPGTESDMFALTCDGRVALYSNDWEQQAVFESSGSDFLFQNRSGRSSDRVSFIFSGHGYTVAEISKKSGLDYLQVVYWRFKEWILSLVVASLFVAIVSTVYRSRARQNLKVISQQNKDLEDAHSKLKKAQATIVSQEKYRQARDIAGGFAHEIRNALFPADGAYRLLLSASEEEFVPAVKVRELASLAANATSRAVDMTDQVLTYAKLDTLYSPELVNLAVVLQEVLTDNRQLINSLNVRVQMDSENEVEVVSNRDQLRVIINNIVLNSCDALSTTDEPQILIDVSATDTEVVVAFRDNGAGIGPNEQSRIFDAFYSTKPEKGTGLGLAFVKKLVELYDGNVWVASRLGEGTSFYLRLKRKLEQ